MKNNILRDLSKGHEGENKVSEYLNQLGIDSWINNEKGKLSYYDIGFKLKAKEFTVEVKNDLYAKRSGNIAIEVFNPKTGKPSGLGITLADFWCHITDGLYFTKVSILKQFAEEYKPFKIISAGGDNNATLYLYKANFLFPKIFIRSANISDKKGLFYFKSFC